MAENLAWRATASIRIATPAQQLERLGDEMLTSIAIFLGLCLAGTVVLIVFGCLMWSIRDRPTLRWNHIACRLVALLVLGFMLLFVTPQVKALLFGFGTELPRLGVMAVQLSDVVGSHLGLFSFVGFAAVGLEAVVLEIFVRREEDEDLEFAKMCSVAGTAGITLVLLFFLFGFALSLVKLLNDLA